MIARYDCELDAGNEDMSPSVSMTQSETGDYVLHEDHVKAVASLSTALREILSTTHIDADERDLALDALSTIRSIVSAALARCSDADSVKADA